jgi:hypothetical protein
MATAPDYPAVPAEKLDGWELVEESVETVFQLPGAQVVGATRQYEDERLRGAVREVTDDSIDHQWRFFAATRLGFDPMLPPGTMPSMILPTMRSEAKKTFKDRLRSRGVEDIERGRRERVRVRSGSRARLVRYDGVDPAAGGVPVAGWVGVWNDGTDFFVVTGGYPVRPLSEVLDLDETRDGLDRTGTTAQNEFLDLLRDVA